MGLLTAPALFLIPLMGHVFVLGPLAGALVGVPEGAAVGGGVGALGGALAAVGVPRDSVIRYETAIKADKFVLIVHDTRDGAPAVERLLVGEGAESVEPYGHG